jgi:hypothetical protein
MELLQGGEKQLGQQYFKYDGFSKTGNCQGYVRALLQGSNIYTPEIDKFVYQPLDKIVERLPSFTSKIAKFTTDLGGIADRLMGGELGGYQIHAIKINKRIPMDEQLEHVRSISKSKKKRMMKELKNVISHRVIAKTKFDPNTYKTKKVNKDISIVFGKLK